MKEEIICKICSNKFIDYKIKKRKFCSKKCYASYNKRENHSKYIGKNQFIDGNCIDCSIKISNGQHKRCRKCNSDYLTKKVMFTHHIRMDKDDNNVIKLSRSKHLQLHRIAYNYLLLINKEKDYIKWFIKNYGTK